MLDKDAARKHLESAQQFVATGYGGVISAGYITTLAADLSEALSEIERKDEALGRIEERAMEDVADKAHAEDAEEKSYLTGRIRGLRLAASMLKDAALTTPSQRGQDAE